MRRKTKKSLRFLSILMLVVLLVSCGINGYCIYQVLGRPVIADSKYNAMTEEEIAIQTDLQTLNEQQKEERDEGYVSYMPLYSDRNNLDGVIVDENDAYQILLNYQGRLGIADAENSYRFAYRRSNDYYDTYMMQQYYDGIEIYNREIRLITDKHGKLISMSGEMASIDNIETTAVLSENEAYSYVEKYLKSEYLVTTDTVNINSMGKRIYINEDDSAIVTYQYRIIDANSNIMVSYIFIDANSGKVISEELQIDGAMTSRDMQGQEVMQTLDVDYDNSTGGVVLRDTNRDIMVLDGYESTGAYKYADGSDPSAVDFLANMQRAYDFYNDVFNYHLGTYILMMKKPAKDQINNFWTYNLDTNAITNRCTDDTSVTSLTKDSTLSVYLDIMGHEYTHAMLPDNVSANTALNEALADIFGELIEDYSDGGFDNSCNWKIGGGSNLLRDIKKPNNTGNAKDISELTNEYYHNSTIISHSAYLMTQGINNTEALSTEQLANLYFNTWNNISGSDFKPFREQIQLTASIMNCNGELSDKQLESVIDAFDQVLISRSASYLSITPDAVIRVTDINDELYADYDYTISKRDGTVVLSGSEKSRVPYLQLENRISPGIYHIVLTDKNTEGITREQWLIINDNAESRPNGYQEYKSTATLGTTFGSKEKEIVLALDCSGSMDGIPAQEAKQASLNFINTIFNVNPNVKISIVKYAENASCSITSSDQNALINDILNLYSHGGTNTREAVSVSKSILDSSTTENKFFIIMSDGIPTDAPDMSQISAMQEDGVTICSLGFFHNLSGSDLTDGISLMSSLASPGYYYNVQDTSDLQAVFNDIAKQVGGEHFSQSRIACPVDVVVSYNGEVLSSAEDTLNTRTSFGNLSFEGDVNEVKILRLNEDVDYEICIIGTGEGTMDYSISFANENGDYNDIRTFESIPITPETVISTNSASSRYTVLNVDSNGDGKFDLHYYAGKNQNAKNQSDTVLLIILMISGVLVAGLLIIETILIFKRFRANRYCYACGAKQLKNARFCSKCGAEAKKVPLIFTNYQQKSKPKKSVVILQLTVIGICCIVTLCVNSIYHSAPNTVFMQIQKSELISAEILYNNNVAESNFSRKYLDWVMMPYLEKVADAQSTERISEVQANTLYDLIDDMNLDESSVFASELLNHIGSKKGEENEEE